MTEERLKRINEAREKRSLVISMLVHCGDCGKQVATASQTWDEELKTFGHGVLGPRMDCKCIPTLFGQ